MCPDGHTSCLRTDDEFDIIGSYSSGRAVLAGLTANPADVLLLDVRMPEPDGPAVARELVEQPPTKVLYVTSYPGEVPIDDALTGAIVGAITKEYSPADLCRIVRLAAGGISMISESIMRKAGGTTSSRASALARDERERQLLDMVCRGYSTGQIAQQLFLSSSTVKKAIAGLCRRAGVTNRRQLAFYLLED